jgi:hypothetical protein
VLACFASGTLFSFLALRRLCSEASARAGSLLVLATPSALDFACSSMDAVFFLYAALAWWLSLRALAARASLGWAAAAGVAFALCALASFSALPLGLALALYGVFQARRAGARLLVSLATIGLAFAACLAAIQALTGFDWYACLQAARENNTAFMSLVAGRPIAALYGRLAYGNAAAFLIGAGVAPVAALLLGARRGGALHGPWPRAALLAFAVLVLGNLHQMETERIWLYALPWLPSIALAAGPLEKGALRLLLASGLAQAAAMEVLLFTLW